MKKAPIFLLLVLLAFACQNASQTQVLEQAVSSTQQLLSDEKALTPQMTAIGDQVEALPERFKTENPEAFATLQRQFNGAYSKREQCLVMLQEGASKSESLLQSKAADVKQQFETQVQPQLKKASETVQQYDQYLQGLKTKADSIARVYGG